MMKMMRRIKKSGRLIIMGKLVHFLMSLQIRRSLTITEIIMCPWEGRDMLNLNIKIRISFHFQMTVLMKLIGTIFMLIFCREG